MAQLHPPQRIPRFIGRTSLSFAVLAGFLLPACLSQGAEAEAEAAERSFSLKVLPLLQEKCFACHGQDPDKIKGDLNLLTREDMLKGGEYSTHVLVPGNAEKSDLYIATTWENDELEMPPKENDRLTPDQISVLRDWINAGAPWPDASVQEKYRREEWAILETDEGIISTTSGGTSDEWTYRRYQPEDLWAFKPVVKPKPPSATGNPIDAFIDSRLADAGFEPAPQATPLTLIRRASYDLTGLPPSPEEIANFTSDHARDPDQAWLALIDRLLANPAYGERWGKHWLDVARYADTGGYSNDYERSNAWRYRDYVIRSFNQDKPYNRFIVEQIAGDELADASVRERVGGDETLVHQARLEGGYTQTESEWLVATGFLRMGPWDNAMVMKPEARQIFLDDVVNSVGQTFLATTMRCFKCHDHKFDPLPTRDYYRMYAAFAGTQMAERKAPFLESENLANFEESKALVERMLAYATRDRRALKAKQEDAAREWFAEHDLEYIPEKDRKQLADELKPPRYVGLDHVEQGRLKVREQDEWIWTRRLERYQPMAQSVYNDSGVGGSSSNARKLRIRKKPDPAWKPANHIFTGGALDAPGDPVGPGVLSAISIPVAGAPENDPYILPDDINGRRLGLARWIADPANPLTTRSIVNRIWQHHFVKPIAGNPNNFGVKGRKPTHPELLDWLAADFVEHGWTFKRMHRLIMTSRAYRQSSNHPRLGELRTTDPDNKLLAYRHPRRLEAEELRDSFLALTGELVPTLGGLPAKPEISMEVALQPRMIQFSLAPAYQPSVTPEQRNRRTIYAYRVRGMADPFLEVFNQPNPNDSCEARHAAPVTPQVFSLINSDLMTDRSIAFAKRLEQEADQLDQQISRAFELALGRQPDPTEQQRLTTFVSDMRTYHRGRNPEPVEYPTRITRSLVEEFSGEPFEYEEILPAFESYQPDTKPADTSPETRALADLCLLLFNSSEFVHVY